MAQFSASSPVFIALSVVLGLASILAVFLRMLARRRSKAHLGVDDLFAVVALCAFLAFLGLIIWSWVPQKTYLPLLTAYTASYNGLHYEFQSLPPKVLENNLKVRRPLRNTERLRSLTASRGYISLTFWHLCLLRQAGSAYSSFTIASSSLIADFMSPHGSWVSSMVCGM